MSLEHRHSILDALMTAMDEDTALDVMEHRRKKKCDLTLRAAKALAREFAKVTDVEKAVDKMVINGWRGFEAEWVPDLCKPVSRPVVVSEDFQRLWDAYPISDSEDYAGAAAAFAEIPLEDNPLILQAASWLKASLPQKFDPTYREKSRFIPSLKKWLSERRYESKRSMFNQMQRQKAQA
jgi:hypothetical protein